MKNYFRIFLAGMVGLMFFSNSSLLAAPRKTEAELIQMLYSGDYHKINDALDRLPNWYPNSTNAILIIKGILRSNEVMVVTQSVQQVSQPVSKKAGVHEEPTAILLPHTVLARMAARALGNYHAPVDEVDLNIIYTFLKSNDVETRMDGLKALHGLNAPQAVPEILPLLKDENPHVLRDACRTLAVLGNTSTIPFIEPLLKSPHYDVKTDAQDAINALRAKK